MARFGHAFDVAPPKVDCYYDAKENREGVRIGSPILFERLAQLIQKTTKILPSANDADRAGQNVVNDQGRNRQFGYSGPNAVSDNDIDAAPYEHPATFHIH